MIRIIIIILKKSSDIFHLIGLTENKNSPLLDLNQASQELVWKIQKATVFRAEI